MTFTQAQFTRPAGGAWRYDGITGQTGFKQRREQFRRAWGPKDLSFAQHLKNFWDKLGTVLTANFVILAVGSQAIRGMASIGWRR